MEVNRVAVTDGLHENEDNDDDSFDQDEDASEEDVQDIVDGKDRELDNMDFFGLYRIVARSCAAGKRILKGRWVVGKRGPGEWRRRWVCKDFKAMNPKEEGLFTPSSHPSTGNIIDVYVVKTGKPTRIADAMNAYWHVDETEEVYCEPSLELIERLRAAGQPCDIVLRMLKKQYGKRDASVAYADWLAGIFNDLGCDRCKDNPCFFKHQERGYAIEVTSR